jgi:hypothetical protein
MDRISLCYPDAPKLPPNKGVFVGFHWPLQSKHQGDMIVTGKGLRLIGELHKEALGVLEVTGSNPVAPTRHKSFG